VKRLEADIVIIGAGTAGLPAAVTAAEGGAKVILFEKKGSTGGTGNRANMVFGVETRLQKLQPAYLTKEQAFKDHMDWTHWRVDTRMVKAFYNKSAETIDWLEKMGIEFEINQYIPGSYNTPHTVKAPTEEVTSAKNVNITMGSCLHMMKILTAKAKELGVQIYPGTPVKKLIKERGKITGVVAESKTKEAIRVKAKAVIVSTGGFGDNPDMLKKHTGFEEGKDLFMIKVLGLKGEGIQMAWAAGAATTDMHLGLMHHLPPPCQGPGGTAPELRAFSQPSNIMVNLLGERFIPEDLRGGHQSVGNSISIQKNRGAFMIFDGDSKKYYEQQDMSFRTADHLLRPLVFTGKDLDENIQVLRGRGYKYLFAADTLEELCTQTGIDYNGLKKTVAEYNEFCKKGVDALFNKDPKYLRPIKTPRFYAARFFPGAYGTVGGIKINYKTEVMTDDFKVIPGLYAAGSDANNIYDITYVPLAGNYMGFAVNTGRIAAESALEYIKTGS